MTPSPPIEQVLVQVARLGLVGRPQDVQAYLRKSQKVLRGISPALAEQVAELLANRPSAGSLREANSPFSPVDSDSRMSLIKFDAPGAVPATPILAADLQRKLDQVIAERRDALTLEKHGLSPTRSLLFVGPPGVGKTLSARWLASQLALPLLTLDLSTVMSSYLGKTGSNIRSVLDYAKSVDSVLLLDEFDAIAKRRDDEGDIGELKRLVTVILQEVDDWPSSNLLIAATNHGELLDPAAWRRFDDVLHFQNPERSLLGEHLAKTFGEQDGEALQAWLPVLTSLWKGRSFSDVNRDVNWIRRRAVIVGVPVIAAITELVQIDLNNAPLEVRREAAGLLNDAGFSDRKVHQATGMSRDTIRKYRRLAQKPGQGGENG